LSPAAGDGNRRLSFQPRREDGLKWKASRMIENAL
jgi:hypothetical protein